MAYSGEPLIFEARTTGNGFNGGGFCPTLPSVGTDYSQQNSPQLSLTDVASLNATSSPCTITSVTGGFTAAMIGNIICSEGTGVAWNKFRAIITGVTNTNTATIEAIDVSTHASAATATGGTFHVGGCLDGVHYLFGITGTGTDSNPLAKGHAHIKAGTYASYGFPLGTYSGADDAYIVEGYTTTRGDGAPTRPVLELVTGQAYSNTLITADGEYATIKNIIFDANGEADSCLAESSSLAVSFINCGFTGGIEWGLNIQGNAIEFDGCDIYLNGDTAQASITFVDSGGIMTFASEATVFKNCRIYDNTGPGVYLDDIAILSRCLIYGNNGCGIYCDAVRPYVIEHNTVYGNVLAGLAFDGANVGGAAQVDNNIFAGNGGYGWHSDTTDYSVTENAGAHWRNNAFYDNDDGDAFQMPAGADSITLSADPFTNAAGDDFSLNNTAGGGADLRGAATTANLDVGALQSAPSGGGGTLAVASFGG